MGTSSEASQATGEPLATQLSSKRKDETGKVKKTCSPRLSVQRIMLVEHSQFERELGDQPSDRSNARLYEELELPSNNTATLSAKKCRSCL